MEQKLYAENERMSTYERTYGGNGREPLVQDKEALDRRARFAYEFCCKWGPFISVPDGEDSEGRAKERLLTSDELVDRAIKLSTKLDEEIRALGWTVPNPPLERIENEDQE